MTSEGSGDHRFSVVIPTYERRDIVLRTLAALSQTEAPWPFEVVVVVDGSSDGTAAAVRQLQLPLVVRVLEQANSGAAAARNAGAAVARGQWLLFLDDDMLVEPRVLAEHDALLSAGADACVGRIDLDPASPPSLLTVGVERWSRLRQERLRRAETLTLADLLTGQLSVRRELFDAIGGFDTTFTADGGFGGEDTDFLHRLLRAGAQVRYAGNALSRQFYVTGPERYLEQWRRAGRSDAVLAAKHPELAQPLRDQHGGYTLRGRALRWVAATPATAPAIASVGRRVLARAASGRHDPATRWAFSQIRDLQYWAGAAAHEAHSWLRVLAYHDVSPAPRLDGYTTSPDAFRGHLQALVTHGVQLAGPGDVAAALQRRPTRCTVVVTFDDAYASVAEHAAPILAEVGAAAAVFVVTDCLGGVNAWDRASGAAEVPLMDAPALLQLQEAGWCVGSHTRSHAHLRQLPEDRLREELAGSREALAAAGLGEPALLAYPYGEHDVRVRGAARRAGYQAALGLVEAQPGPNRKAAFAVPRIEVRADLEPARLLELLQNPPTDRRRGPGADGRALVRIAAGAVATRR